jgi:hypothetical protein
MRASVALGAAALAVLARAAAAQYAWETAWFTQRLDHYNFANAQTFQQRYLINDTYWQRPSATQPAGPIFFYTGACRSWAGGAVPRDGAAPRERGALRGARSCPRAGSPVRVGARAVS